VEELIGYIENYKAQRGRSLYSLAREAGVAYTTLKRIVNKEVNNADFETVSKILNVLCTPEQIVNYLKKNHPAVSNIMATAYNTYTISNNALNSYLVDKIGFVIIHRAMAKDGITRSEVIEQFGEQGSDLLEELLGQEILLEVDNRITAKDFKCTSIDVALKKVQLACDNFKARNIGDGKSLISFQVEGWADWAVDDIYKKLQGLLNYVGELSKDPNAKGNNVVFLATLLNRLEGKGE